MADNSIQFRIGSSFEGEGFQKAQNAVKSMNGEVNLAKESLMKITGALGGMDSAAAKSMNAITGLITSFGRLNPVMLAITAATSAITWGINQCNEAQQRAKERADALRESIKKIKDDFGQGFIDKVVSETKKLTTEFEKIASAANSMSAAVASMNATNAQGGILDLQIEKIKASFEAADENTRKMSDAFFDVKIESEKLKKTQQEVNDANAAATKAVNDLGEKINIGRDELNKLNEQIDKKNQQLESAYGDEQEEQRLKKELNNLMSKRQEVETAIQDLQDKTQVAIVKENETREKGRQKLEEQNAAVEKATVAQMKLEKEAEDDSEALKKEAEWARADAESAQEEARMRDEMKQAENEVANAKKELAEVTKDAAEAQKKSNESCKAVEEAEREYKEALKSYHNQWADNKMWEAFFGEAVQPLKAVAAEMGKNGLDKAMAEEAIKNAIANGTVRTVKDLDTYAKQAQREARDRISKTKAQVAREKQRYERLQDQNRKTWSKADKDFVAKFEKLRDAALAQKKDLDKKEARLKEAKKIAQEDHDNLKAIKEKLNALGLK